MDPAAPGPSDPSILTMQADHRSTLLWDAQVSDTDTLYCRHPDSAPWEIDDRIIPYLRRARLYDYHQVAYGRVDRPMITALVERWRQETHTFHLPLGEATVTLLDIAVLSRLPIEGHAVSTVGRQLDSWQDIVERVLGQRPPGSRGSALRATWLIETFRELPVDADEGTIERYAKAYLFYLIGAVLFADKSSGEIQMLYITLLDQPWERIGSYSWGSGALAYLYRSLCRASKKNVKEISGPLVLLQFWAWEHICVGQPLRPVGRGAVAHPQEPAPDVPWGIRWLFDKRTRTHTSTGVGFYRDQLDLLRADQFAWDPYPATAYAALPEHSGMLTGTWRSAVPLICFDIVELHLPERVLRQYGMVQGIPPECNTDAHLHRSNRMGPVPKNWSDINALHIALWDQRQDYIRQSMSIDQANGVPTTPDYLPWFLSITRRWMTPRHVVAAAQYVPAAPMMTAFAQGMASVIRTSQEVPVREMAQTILRGSQFENFIPDVEEPAAEHTDEEPSTSPPRHLDDLDVSSYPHDDAGSSQAPAVQYQSPPLPERHATASYYRKRRTRPSQLDRVDEE